MTTASEKYHNRYRIPSNRLRGWNYAKNGHYFITIVTHGRHCVFGNVVDGEMILNDFGQIVYDEFFKSFTLRDELFLGEFVIMPNHLHAIVILDNDDAIPDGTDDFIWGIDNPTNVVETHGRASLQQQTNEQQTHGRASLPHRQPKSISSFVAGFKSSAINRIDDWIDANNPSMDKFNRANPLWQANYHDHIIRNQAEYQRISNYIINNPTNWNDDTLK